MAIEPVISAEGLGKRFRIWTHSKPTSLSDRVRLMFLRAREPEAAPLRQEIWALRDVSFEVGHGEVLGVIGPNGAGKSTLLSVLARITEPTEGQAVIRGRVSSLLEVGTGFHPELSGRDNVFLNGAVLGMSRSETAKKFDEIVEFSGVGDFIDMPVKRYSSGMYVRLAFSVAAHLDPEVLLLDEVLAVGDQSFQQKCLRRIEEITSSGRTVLFVSHDVNSVARLCKQALVINNGHVVFHGDVDEAIDRYMSSEDLGGQTVATRSGSGEVRVTEVTVEDASGGRQLVPDRPAVMRLELRGQPGTTGRNVDVNISIGSVVGGHLTTLSTQFDPELNMDSLDLGGAVSMSCWLDELPLKPGHYYVSVMVTRLGAVLDSVDRVADFTLRPSDFFGGGVLPPENLGGHVLVRHRWSADLPASPVGSASVRAEELQ